MKFFVILFSVLIAYQAEAYTPYGPKECEEADAKVDIYASRDSFEPRVIYVKEKDRVCFVVHPVDTSVVITIEGYPSIYVTVLANAQAKMEYFRAEKVGEFKIKCRMCGLRSNPKLIVESREKFEKDEERVYRRKSQDYRKNEPTQFDTRRGYSN